MDGDGLTDLLVGASGYSDGEVQEGAAFLYLGTGTGLETSPAWMAEANQAQSYFGNSVALVGDTDGDGFDDILVGAHYFDDPQPDEGKAFLFAGEPTPDCDDSDAALYPGNGCP